MKLREKWAKQNNSVKLLLRKLRRHDTFVVAIAVVIAMFLCGGLIYFSTPVVTANAKQELEESERQNNEKTIEKLDELSEYLDGLDKSITDSKDSISSYYEKAGKDTNLVNEKNTEKITNNVNEKVTGLGNNLNTLHETITTTQNNIDRLKEIIEKNDESGSREREAMLSEIDGELDNIKNQHSKAQQDTKELIKELEKLLGQKNDDLSKQSKQQNEELSKQSKDQNDELSQQLKDQGDELSKQSKEEKDALSKQIQEGNDKLFEKIEGDDKQLSEQLTNSKDALSGQMKDSKDQLSEQMTNSKDSLSEQMTNTKDSLSEQLTNSKAELSKQISDGNSALSKEMKEQYQALLNALSESDKKLSEQNSEMLTSFQTEISNLSKELTGILAQMNTNVDEMEKSITNNINAGKTENKNRFDKIDTNISGMNTKMEANFNTFNTNVQGDFDDLKTYLDKQNATINGKLQEVFWRVSKGKKLLASALLTKNVSIREDASFAEIAEAIKSIPTQVVLDNGDVAGKVEYVLHYHVDGKGTECDELYVPVERMGGCYTEEYYHEHDKNCYTSVAVYGYYTNRGVSRVRSTGEKWGGEDVAIFDCPYCGEFDGTNSYHYESTTDYDLAASRQRHDTLTTTYQDMLTCQIPVGTLVGYTTSCNMVHGQIVAANITFVDKYAKYNHVTQLQPGSKASTNVATSHMMAPVSGNLFEGLASKLISFGGADTRVLGNDLDEESFEEAEEELKLRISEDELKELSADPADPLEGEDTGEREDSTTKESLTSGIGENMSIVSDSDTTEDVKTEGVTDDQDGKNSLQDDQKETANTATERDKGLNAENADE